MVTLREYAVPSGVWAPLLSPIVFSDAAGVPRVECLFRGGLYAPGFGCRTFLMMLPGASLQVAEFFTLIRAFRIAVFQGYGSVTLVGDNLASLVCFQKLAGLKGSPRLRRSLRRLFNLWWRLDVVVHLFWVPTALNPADPVSRLGPRGLVDVGAWEKVQERVGVVLRGFGVLRFVGSVFV